MILVFPTDSVASTKFLMLRIDSSTKLLEGLFLTGILTTMQKESLNEHDLKDETECIT